MFNIFKPSIQSGALPDTRGAEAKEKDVRFEEIVATAYPVQWEEKPRETWRKFPIFNQNGSFSCVAQTMAKLMGILYWLKNGVYVHFSASHIYQRRINKPLGGMGGVNCFDIAKQGVTLEVLAPSQAMTDAQMDAVKIEQYKKEVGEIFKIGGYVQFPIKDIDTIASTIQTTKKGVMVWFFFEYSEWTNVPFIKNTIELFGSKTIRHSVTAVDFTMYEGEKALIIEDSWGEQYGFGGQRVIKESFFKERNFFAAYPIEFKFDTVSMLPKHTFTIPLSFSAQVAYPNRDDVAALQDILKYEGFFPKNVDSTGYYGALTAKGVLAFQRKYRVAPESELAQLQGRYCGTKTIAKLNELYG